MFIAGLTYIKQKVFILSVYSHQRERRGMCEYNGQQQRSSRKSIQTPWSLQHYQMLNTNKEKKGVVTQCSLATVYPKSFAGG